MAAGGEVGFGEHTGLHVVVGIGTEDPYFVEVVAAVPVGVAVEAGVDAGDEQATARECGFEDFGVVAVFDKVELVGAGRGEEVGHGAGDAVADGVKGVGAGGGDDGDAVDPVAVFVFHVGAHVLWRFGVVGHEVPGADGSHFGAFVVAVEVGGTEGVEHLVAEGTGAEIVGAGSFEGEVEGVDLFAVDGDVVAVEVPLVGPKEVAPAGVGAFDDEVDVVDVAVAVVVEVVGGGNGEGVVDKVDGAYEQFEFTFGALAVVGVALGVVVAIGHIVASGMGRLVGSYGVAVGGGGVVGADKELVVGDAFEEVVDRGAFVGRGVGEHFVDGGKGSRVVDIVGEADEDDQVAVVAVVAVSCFGLGYAILFGDVPGVATFEPLVASDSQAWCESCRGGVDGADRVGRGLDTAIGCGHGIDPVAVKVLYDGEVVVVMVAVVAFIASGEKVQRVAIGLYHGHGHFLDIDGMGVETAKQ